MDRRKYKLVEKQDSHGNTTRQINIEYNIVAYQLTSFFIQFAPENLWMIKEQKQ